MNPGRNQRTILILLLFTLGSVHVFGQNSPNIIFILTDDQAPWALGLSGDPNARTPNMDKLAREGTYLKNAFCTTPVCSPSRVSILSGRYSSELNVLDFIPHPDHRLFNLEYIPGLDPGSVTFAEVVRDQGYVTGLVGKWHVGDWTLSADKKFHPTNHGFDYFMGLPGGGCAVKDPELEKEGEIRQFSGLMTDILTDNVPAFISWPGVISSGTVIENTVSSLDLFPTLVEMAGGTLPQDYPIRGRSIVPLLHGKNLDDWDNDYYGEYSMINYCKSFMRCYRTQKWKLILDFLNPERNELYHIAFDPEENINLYSYSDNIIDKIKSDLRREILVKMREINDPLLKEGNVVRVDYYLNN